MRPVSLTEIKAGREKAIFSQGPGPWQCQACKNCDDWWFSGGITLACAWLVSLLFFFFLNEREREFERKWFHPRGGSKILKVRFFSRPAVHLAEPCRAWAWPASGPTWQQSSVRSKRPRKKGPASTLTGRHNAHFWPQLRPVWSSVGSAINRRRVFFFSFFFFCPHFFPFTVVRFNTMAYCVCVPRSYKKTLRWSYTCVRM